MCIFNQRCSLETWSRSRDSSRDPFLLVSVSKVSGLVSVSKAGNRCRCNRLSRCNRCGCIGPRASGGPVPRSLGRLFTFARYPLHSRIQQKRLITLLASNVLIQMNGEFPLISLIEGYQTCSILILELYICAPPPPTLNG